MKSELLEFPPKLDYSGHVCYFPVAMAKSFEQGLSKACVRAWLVPTLMNFPNNNIVAGWQWSLVHISLKGLRCVTLWVLLVSTLFFQVLPHAISENGKFVCCCRSLGC